MPDTGRSSTPSASFLPATAAPSRALPSLLGLSMRRDGGRRAVSVVVVVLLLSGVGMLGFPAFTDLFHQFHQRQVQDRLSDPGFRTLYREHHVKVGEGLTRLIINNARVKVNVLVVEGTTLAALQAGAGHYVDTPFPCERGNVGIAGHRTTYGRPFNKIDQMHKGDTVDLITPFAKCTYQVVPGFAGHGNPFVVQPNDYGVVSQRGALGTGHWLTLTSCNPLGSDAQRIVLRLRLIKTTPLPHKKASA